MVYKGVFDVHGLAVIDVIARNATATPITAIDPCFLSIILTSFQVYSDYTKDGNKSFVTAGLPSVLMFDPVNQALIGWRISNVFAYRLLREISDFF